MHSWYILFLDIVRPPTLLFFLFSVFTQICILELLCQNQKMKKKLNISVFWWECTYDFSRLIYKGLISLQCEACQPKNMIRLFMSSVCFLAVVSVLKFSSCRFAHFQNLFSGFIFLLAFVTKIFSFISVIVFKIKS